MKRSLKFLSYKLRHYNEHCDICITFNAQLVPCERRDRSFSEHFDSSSKADDDNGPQLVEATKKKIGGIQNGAQKQTETYFQNIQVRLVE